MVEAAMIISNKMDAQGGESEATERSDDTLSEEEEDEEPSGGANEEERRLLDELEGLEEAEEEEYSGPLLAEQEEEEDEGEAEEDVDEEEARAEEAEAEEEGPEEGDVEPGVLDFLKRPPEQDEGTPQEQADFSRELEQFFSQRKMDHRTPKFYGENLNLLKLWRTVIRLGAYDYVTAHKLWRQVGETFNPPKKCTTVSWSFRIYYEKSLLDYERHMLHGTGCSSVQGGSPSEMVEGPSGALQNGAAQPQGRARRDAAMRAMQGWHSQRILDNEEVGIANTKDKSSVPIAKRDKQLKMGFLKRKNPSTPERAVKAARLMNRARPYILDDATIKDENGDHGHQSFNPMKRRQGNTKQLFKSSNHNLVNGADIRVADEGPQADWVKINVHRTCDCFEVYALVPGLLQEELRIQCEPGGHLVIIGEPEQPNNPWGVTPFKKVIKLPSPIDANQTSAVITLHGQLFVRVPYGEART